MWLISVMSVFFANEYTPIFDPFWVHEGATHKHENLAKITHWMHMLFAHGGVMLVISCYYLI